MILPTVRLEIYKKIVVGDDISYASTPDYVLDSFTNLSTMAGIEARKDSISFSLSNERELINESYVFDYGNKFTIDTKDLIKIYAYNSPMTGVLNDHLIMIAYIKSFTYDSTEAVGKFNFTCYNRSEVLLNSFMFFPYYEGNRTVPYMIVDSINKVKTYNRNDRVEAYLDYTGATNPGTKAAYSAAGTLVSGYTGYIRAYKKAAYKNDGSGELLPAYTSSVPDSLKFDNATYAETYKPYLQNLETLSTPKFTGDITAGVYVNYVDNDSNLHWEPKQFNVTATVYEKDHTSMSITKDNDDIINAVILNCGTGPDETGILTLAFNASSMGLNGARWKYIARTDIADDIRKNEINSGDRVIDGEDVDGDDNIGNFIGDDNFPDAYNWNIQTTGSDSEFDSWEYEVGDAVKGIVNSNKNYKIYFRRVAGEIGKKIGDDIVKYAGQAKYSCKWELELGTLIYSANQLIAIEIPSMNFSKKLRIMSIQHTFQETWKTTLMLEEDIDYNELSLT